MKARKYCLISAAALASKPWSISPRPAAGRTRVAAEETISAMAAIGDRAPERLQEREDLPAAA